MQTFNALSSKGKITLGIVAVGFLAAAVLLFRFAGQPSWQTVQTGLSPADTGKVTDALSEKGITFELQQGGTAIAVDKAQAAQARIALASAGVAGSASQPGFELLDKQKLGASSFQQQVAYQRALEGQIAKTISQIDGVGNAQVRLSLPKDRLFADEAKPATAAVLLGTAGGVDAAAVRGVANLVAASVPDLKPSAVTVTDSTGTMLWPQGEGGGDGAATSKQAAQARYEAQLSASLDAMLTRTLGPDKAQVQVRADLDADQATEEKLTYGEGTPVEQTEETESLEGSGSSGGAAGTTTNVPQFTAGGSSGGESNYRKSATKTQFGVDKTVTRTTKATGAVQKLSIAVLVDDKALKPSQVATLQRAVEAAAGAEAGRDTVSVQRVPFAEVDDVEPPASGLPIPVPEGMLGPLKAVGIGLAALIFLFFVSRHLRRREDEVIAEAPSWLRQLQAPSQARAEVGPGLPDDTAVIPSMVQFDDPRKVAVEDLIQREPERVAAQLRTWIQDDG